MLRTLVQSEEKDVTWVLRPLATASSRFSFSIPRCFCACSVHAAVGYIRDSKTSTACTKVPTAWHPCWVLTVIVVSICCRFLTQPDLEGQFRVKECPWESNKLCLQKEKGGLYDQLTSRVRWAEKKFPLQWCVHFLIFYTYYTAN